MGLNWSQSVSKKKIDVLKPGPVKVAKKKVAPEEGTLPDNMILVTIPDELMKNPGMHKIPCPMCNQLTILEIKSSGQSEVKQVASTRTPDALELWPEHPVVIAARMKQRVNKKTVVMVGTHPQSLALAPLNETGIDELWGLNDSATLKMIETNMDRFDRWFQLHHRWRVTRHHTRLEEDHWDWLQKDHGDMKIYMQRKFADVPNAVKFEMREISDQLIGGMLPRGAGFSQRYYSSTFAYAIAQMIYEKVNGINDWERCEIYGCELVQTEMEYFRQRPNIEWWLGYARGVGIEVYVPMITRILYSQKQLQNGQMMQYPGYMAYGYMSPTMVEAQERQEPIGEDPVEENMIGSWEDSPYRDFNNAFLKGVFHMEKAAASPDFVEELKAVSEFEDSFWSAITEPDSG